LENDFEIKKGQIAHLDRNPSNSKLGNLCFLCLQHHDEYDTKQSQSKGYKPSEIKRYINRLNEKVAQWRETEAYANNFPAGVEVPLLSNYVENEISQTTTSRGTQIVEMFAGIRLIDKELSGKDGPVLLNISIGFVELQLKTAIKKTLRVRAELPVGLTLNIEVSAWDDWDVLGFMNVLNNQGDIWMLRGDPIQGDKRDPMFHGRDALLVYRKSNGENRIILGTYTKSLAQIQIHARVSDYVAKGLADYLERVGFSALFLPTRHKQIA
jgi:hypothetical protein